MEEREKYSKNGERKKHILKIREIHFKLEEIYYPRALRWESGGQTGLCSAMQHFSFSVLSSHRHHYPGIPSYHHHHHYPTHYHYHIDNYQHGADLFLCQMLQ